MIDYAKKAPGVYVEQVLAGTAPIAGASTSTAGFVGIAPTSIPSGLAPVGRVQLVTNFTEFKSAFGDFSTDSAQSNLAHAVYGFFNNGGSRCYVTWVAPSAGGVDIAPALALLEPIDEISIVAAPGLTDPTHYAALVAHCASMPERFAILDTARDLPNDNLSLLTATPGNNQTSLLPGNADSAALYFPWIQVFDPASKATKFVPPSGHMAGVYARVDGQRGVFKAPANEVIHGATDLRYAISRQQQDGLNPQGVNCLRRVNGNIRVWGARTVGGSANADFTYVNVRRLFNYIRGSIEQGTQWAVFEPNNPDLWGRITRNVTAFLQIVWQSGGLIGETADKAFYVKCDAETNPPAVRDLGQVVTEVGVAITRPAEFVVFRLGQTAAS
ncbi:Phage tail sheath protein FI [Minicystis rosea]|nr:Phage tail sheath protein FI [Minicystis rosea]